MQLVSIWFVGILCNVDNTRAFYVLHLIQLFTNTKENCAQNNKVVFVLTNLLLLVGFVGFIQRMVIILCVFIKDVLQIDIY